MVSNGAGRPAARALLAALLVAAAAGCADDATGPGVEAGAPTLTVDADEGWAFVSLGSGGRVTVSDPAGSTGWDLAFFATSVMLNGGAAGPGGVEGHCLCQNAGATLAEVKAMTAASQLAAFEAVTAAEVPAADSAWQSDVLSPAISGWYRYDMATHTVAAAADRAWLFRTAEGTAFAKLRVADLEGPTRATAGRVTLEFAVQQAQGAAMGAAQTLTVDLSSGEPVYVDLLRGAVSDAQDWDLRLEGYEIRINGGVSGSGRAGALPASEPFASIDDASGAPLDATDEFGGVFDASPWYRYDMAEHQVWPTYDVYLVRRGADVYKVQVTGYYGPTGDDRQITFRYARVEG